jgi:integrase
VVDVQALYDRCVETGRPRSARSIELVVATLRRILTYAEAREVVDRNVVEVWKRGRGRSRRSSGDRIDPENVLNSEELERLLNAARNEFPAFFPLIQFLADTGARLGEASALRWTDLNLEARTARICRSFSNGKDLTQTKTGETRTVELSTRLHQLLTESRPDIFGDEDLAFPNEEGGFVDPHNFRNRVFSRLVRNVLGRGRRFTPHGLRHTFASLHIARGTNLKRVQAQGGWASAKMLLDRYGHYLPTETTSYADALTSGPGRPCTAPVRRVVNARRTRVPKRRGRTKGSLAPRGGIEPRRG